jgi:hypothetical protein
MLIQHKNQSYKTKRSIIVSGPTASGKSFLINRLTPVVTKAMMVHREVAEAEKSIPASSIIHWPAAEKMPPQEMSYANAGVVLLLGKDWDTYCENVNARDHRTQYSRIGLEDIYNNWRCYFIDQNVPTVDVECNDKDMSKIIEDLLCAMRLVILL